MVDKKTLLLDVDEVICFSGFVEAINDFLGTNYTVDDFTDYYIDEVAIPDDKRDEFNLFLNNRNMYDKKQILPNAKEVLKDLSKLYDIHILSSCVNPLNIKGSGHFFKDKYDFLIEEFPCLDPRCFIFTSNKNVIKGDIIIDDNIVNLKNDVDTKILFPSYHNGNIETTELEKYKIVRTGLNYRDGWINIERLLIDGDSVNGNNIPWVKTYIKNVNKRI